MYIIPVEKDNPVKNRPVAIWVLLAVNVAIFLATYHSGRFDSIVTEYGIVPASVTSWQALSYMFLHADYLHLIGNMFFLWMFGDNIEDILGGGRFFLSYLACGLLAAGAHIAVSPASAVPMVGASGAISGILGIYLFFFRYAHIDLAIYIRHSRIKTLHLSGQEAIGGWVLYQLLLGMVALLAGSGNFFGVAVWAHVGGAVCGALLGILFRKIGFAPELPLDRPLRFARYSYAPVWCPQCGHEEESRDFGLYECSVCNVRYEIVDSRPEDSGEGSEGRGSCYAFVYFRENQISKAADLRRALIPELGSECLVLGIHRSPGQPHPGPMFPIEFPCEMAGHVRKVLKANLTGQSAFMASTSPPEPDRMDEPDNWVGQSIEAKYGVGPD